MRTRIKAGTVLLNKHIPHYFLVVKVRNNQALILGMDLSPYWSNALASDYKIFIP